jgi:hypothetical protein
VVNPATLLGCALSLTALPAVDSVVVVVATVNKVVSNNETATWVQFFEDAKLDTHAFRRPVVVPDTSLVNAPALVVPELAVSVVVTSPKVDKVVASVVSESVT